MLRETRPTAKLPNPVLRAVASHLYTWACAHHSDDLIGGGSEPAGVCGGEPAGVCVGVSLQMCGGEPAGVWRGEPAGVCG